MNREKDGTLLEAPFVALRFVFGDAKSDQRTGESTDCATDADACQCSSHRSSSDERTYARNGQCANPGQ